MTTRVRRQLLVLGLVAAAACGSGDDGPPAVDATVDGSVNATPIDVVFDGETFTLNSGIASALGDTVLDIQGQADFGIILSDQPLSCDLDLAARPAPGIYAILYLDSIEEGTFSPTFAALLSQTTGPRTSSTRQGGTTEITSTADLRVAGTADHDWGAEEDNSIVGSFDVPACP